MRNESGQVGQAAGSNVEPKPSPDARERVLGAAQPPTAPPEEIAPNYRYWREHGGEWAAEYDNRKKEQVYYHIQEVMLTEYVRHHAPAKVLEFGCGPGRHLKNLCRLPGIEVFGYDQSASMVSGARAWATQEWLDSHVSIGPPTGRLPFADGQFDLVYTAEVLVHVRPEDLEGVLSELMRVSKRQVFHLETSPQHQLFSGEHEGCWYHDLVAAYARLGKRCEMLPSGYSTHAPYRVVLDPKADAWQWSSIFLELCRRMDRDVSHSFDLMRGSIVGEKEGRALEAKRAEDVAAQARERVQSLEQSMSLALDEARRQVQRANAEAAAREALVAAVAQLESRLVNVQHDLAHKEQDLVAKERELSAKDGELARLAQREAEFIREVDRRVTAGGEAAADALALKQSRADVADRVLERIAEQSFEIYLIKHSRTYKIAHQLRTNPLLKLPARALGRRSPRVTISVTGASNPNSKGHEAWLLAAYMNAGEPALPWEFMHRKGEWQERHDPAAPYGRCLISTGGEVSLSVGTSPELVFLSHPWSGKVKVSWNGRTEEVDLYSEQGGRVRIFPARTPMAQATASADEKSVDAAIPAGPVTSALSASQEAFLSRTRLARASVVAVHCPRWLGVTNSTKNLFEHLYAVPESPAHEPYHLSELELSAHARVLLDSGASTIVFSGGDEAHYRLMRLLRRARPSLRFIMLWHGNYVQLSDNYAFKTLNLWIEAAKQGHVASIGTVKAGMERFFTSLGVRSHFVMNYIKETAPPSSPPAISTPGTHLGLWMSGTLWKTPNVMLAAAKLIPGAVVHAAGIDPRTKELLEQYNIPAGFISTRPLPFDELMRRIRLTHLTMYVTFTECCPMIPLESFAQGVPAIVGPTSHLFEDDDYLRTRLVVPFPDRADVIADTIKTVLEEREQIVARYAAYAPGYAQRARASVVRLLA
jgi:SAM-dependent methyltransferase